MNGPDFSMAEHRAVQMVTNMQLRAPDWSYAEQHMQQGAMELAYEMNRPSTIYRPRLTIDGDQWCALHGENLQDGVAGFGSSPSAAYSDFDRAWVTPLALASQNEEGTHDG